jgi:nucleotide sugar dehydrogenase
VPFGAPVSFLSPKEELKVAIVGLGYVGLPTAVLFAEAGFQVLGCDVKQESIDRINRGESPLKDLDLDDRVKQVVNVGALKATNDVVEATKRSDVIIIIVPTPTKEGEEPDLSYIESAGHSIAKGLTKGKLVILESTVYPGVTETVLKPILETSGLKAGVDFDLSYCPERYNPGDSEHTIEHTKRICSGINQRSRDTAAYLYSKINKAGVVPVRDIMTAEAAKIIENTQRDLNIALMNEFALILERLGLDVIEVIDAAATKWNFNKYQPGAGVGGHCLPKDPYYLVKTAEKHGYHAQVITAGRKINDFMPHHMFELLVHGLNKSGKAVKNSKIVVLGVSYKDNVGDTRKAPTLKLLEDLRRKEAHIVTVDAYVPAKVVEKEFLVPMKDHHNDLWSAVMGADAVVLMTAHQEFRGLDLKKLRSVMNEGAVFVDGRRIYHPDDIKAAGFVYQGIGAGRDN